MVNSDVTAAIEGHPDRRILANRIDAQAAASMPILTGHCQRMTTCACVAGVALRKNRLDVHVRDIHVDVHVPTCNVILAQRRTKVGTKAVQHNSRACSCDQFTRLHQKTD